METEFKGSTSTELNYFFAESNLYNNEMIGIISLYFVMSKFECINTSKAMLILPMTTHNALISYLNDSRTTVKGLEQFMIKKPEFFSNFDQRFYSLIELSINSILILLKLNIISINEDNNLRVNDNYRNSFLNENLGDRANKIKTASSAVAELLYDKVENLYLQLRVKL